MTTEERLDRLEETDRKLSELMVEVIRLVHQQDGRLERQDEQLQLQREELQLQKELLAEVREDTKMTRRLWVRLATKHGWLDEDDLNGDGA